MNVAENAGRHKRVCAVWAHLYEVQEQPETVYGQVSGKGRKGNFEGAGDVFYLDLGNGYKKIHKKKNPRGAVLIFCFFTFYKLYLNNMA